MYITLYMIEGIIFGLAVAFWLVTTQLKESNNIGDSKGDRITYTRSFNITDSKDNVKSDFYINSYNNFENNDTFNPASTFDHGNSFN